MKRENNNSPTMGLLYKQERLQAKKVSPTEAPKQRIRLKFSVFCKKASQAPTTWSILYRLVKFYRNCINLMTTCGKSRVGWTLDNGHVELSTLVHHVVTPCIQVYSQYMQNAYVIWTARVKDNQSPRGWLYIILSPSSLGGGAGDLNRRPCSVRRFPRLPVWCRNSNVWNCVANLHEGLRNCISERKPAVTATAYVPNPVSCDLGV